MSQQRSHLLAVDIGLHLGLALYDGDARLLWYRSHHIASTAKLKKIIGRLLREPPQPSHLFLEGGGPLLELWRNEADKLGMTTFQLTAEQWRGTLLHARQQRSGQQAKREALILARQVIAVLGGKNPTGLRHDTAEAILIGLYGLLLLGWLKRWPPDRAG